jgi:hypothetical protein
MHNRNGKLTIFRKVITLTSPFRDSTNLRDMNIVTVSRSSTRDGIDFLYVLKSLKAEEIEET